MRLAAVVRHVMNRYKLFFPSDKTRHFLQSLVLSSCVGIRTAKVGSD